VYADAVRALLRAQRHGVLATLSARHDGWPFASVTPYALSDAGEPILLLSDLAEHTHNVKLDERASLFVYDTTAADPQAGARVTLLGRVVRDDEPVLRQRYVEWHAQAEQYVALTDFGVYVLKLEHARYVGGFGEMGWMPAHHMQQTSES
jgi:putative heme iron utilization protein